MGLIYDESEVDIVDGNHNKKEISKETHEAPYGKTNSA